MPFNPELFSPDALAAHRAWLAGWRTAISKHPNSQNPHYQILDKMLQSWDELAQGVENDPGLVDARSDEERAAGLKPLANPGGAA